VIDPESLSTTWKIESDYDVTPSGSGDEAEFTVQIPEDASGPIEFDVAFTVATEGPYPELLEEHNCNNMEVESGRVPVIVHPVKLIIKYEPEEPWAGDVVSYSLGEGSLVPPDMEVQWSAPNNLNQCGSSVAQQPTPIGGAFKFPPYKEEYYTISVSVCENVEHVPIKSRCHDCTAYAEEWTKVYVTQYDLALLIKALSDKILIAEESIGTKTIAAAMMFGIKVIGGCSSVPASGGGLQLEDLIESLSDQLNKEEDKNKFEQLMMNIAEEREMLKADKIEYQQALSNYPLVKSSTSEAKKELYSCLNGAGSDSLTAGALCKDALTIIAKIDKNVLVFIDPCHEIQMNYNLPDAPNIKTYEKYCWYGYELGK